MPKMSWEFRYELLSHVHSEWSTHAFIYTCREVFPVCGRMKPFHEMDLNVLCKM